MQMETVSAPRFSVLTLGCRVNQYESDVIVGEMEKDGFRLVPFGEACEVAIVNTCTVTAESDRKSRQHIRRAAAAASAVIVTGCFSQVSPEDAARIPGVTALVGNGDKAQIPALARRLLTDPAAGALEVSDIMTAPYDTMVLRTPRRARAYIKIEDGCENRCAYCIIPRARGKVRSKPMEDILSEACALTRVGCPEVILTGIETAAYGRDSGGRVTLAQLLTRLGEIPGVYRIGLGSLDPSLMRDDFIETAARVPSVLPHIHLSLQSGSSSVLRRMRRPYNAAQAMDRIRALRAAIPEIMLTADVIVGFPGESEAEFEETLRFCREAQFLHLHVFPYSIRHGTEAAEMSDQIPDDEKRRRAALLAARQAEDKAALLRAYTDRHRATPVQLLIEEAKNGVSVGHSEHYAEVRLDRDAGSAGTILPVYLTHTDGEICYGIPAES